MERSQRTLHGGSKGFSDVLCTVKRHIEDSHITFTDDSRDGEEGSPGDLSVSVHIRLPLTQNPHFRFQHQSGTAYDFLEPREIGSRINELPDG